jgi:hypothetical protein
MKQKFSRRRILAQSSALLLAASGAILGRTAVSDAADSREHVGISTDQSVNIYSPDDCFVETVFVASGPVTIGQQVLLLTSQKVEDLLERIDTFGSILSIAERKFEDGRVAEQKQLQTTILDKLSQAATAADSQEINEQNNFHLGVTDEQHLAPTIIGAMNADINQVKQQSVVADFDRNIADQKDQLAAMKKHLDFQRTQLVDFKKRLLIQAPFAGRFETKAWTGLFFKKGQIVGTMLKS